MYNYIYTRFNFIRAGTAGGTEAPFPTGSFGSCSSPPFTYLLWSCLTLHPVAVIESGSGTVDSACISVLVPLPYTIRSRLSPAKLRGSPQKMPIIGLPPHFQEEVGPL